MGKGPCLLTGGCEHRGAGTLVSRQLGRRGAGHPCLLVPGPMLPTCGSWAGGTVLMGSPVLLPCAGTAPARAAQCCAGACGDEGPSSPLSPGWGRGGHPACPLHPRTGLSLAAAGSGAPVLPTGMEAGMQPPVQSPSPRPCVPSRDPLLAGTGGPSFRARCHKAAPSGGNGMEAPPRLIAQGGVGGIFASSLPAQSPALLGPSSLGKWFEAKGNPRGISLGVSSRGRHASGWMRGAALWMCSVLSPAQRAGEEERKGPAAWGETVLLKIPQGQFPAGRVRSRRKGVSVPRVWRSSAPAPVGAALARMGGCREGTRGSSVGTMLWPLGSL